MQHIMVRGGQAEDFGGGIHISSFDKSRAIEETTSPERRGGVIVGSETRIMIILLPPNRLKHTGVSVG
jgi:hypothetical protein